MRRAAKKAIVCAAAGAVAIGASVAAFAQHVDVKRPRTFVVGPHHAGAPTDRVDGARTGLARAPLPDSRIVVAWRRTVGPTASGAPVVDENGNVFAVVGRGEVVTLAADGVERARVATGMPQPSAPALLSDGTVVFTSATGEAVGVRRGAVRFRTRVGRPDSAAVPAAPLPLDDGGAVVATAAELALLDAEGDVRARASLTEPIAAPLVSAMGQVVVVGASGAVYGWSPGRDAARIGSFGGPIDGGAALADAHTLVAVTGGGFHLAALGLARGVTVTRATAPVGVYLGPPAMRGESAFLLGYTDTNVYAVALDASGNETSRVALAPTPTSAAPDGGAAPLVVPPHAGPLVDAAGTMAFVTPEGLVGVAASSGVDTLGESVCGNAASPPSPPDPPPPGVVRGPTPARPPPGVPLMVPAGQGAFLLACPTGVVAKVRAASPSAH